MKLPKTFYFDLRTLSKQLWMNNLEHEYGNEKVWTEAVIRTLAKHGYEFKTCGICEKFCGKEHCVSRQRSAGADKVGCKKCGDGSNES